MRDSISHEDAGIIEAAWYRQFWPWFLIALPTVAVIACLISLAIAMRHSDSALRDDYSKQGLVIEAANAADTEAQRLQLHAVLSIAADGRIDVDLSGRLKPASILLLEFIHPLDKQHDLQIALSADSTSHYRGTVPTALSGRWSIELKQPGQTWRLRAIAERRPQRELKISL